MVQRTKIFQTLILKHFSACFEVFPERGAKKILRRKVSVTHRAIAFSFKTYYCAKARLCADRRRITCLLMLENGFALVSKGRHTFLLVFKGETGVKNSSLEKQPLIHPAFKSAID